MIGSGRRRSRRWGRSTPGKPPPLGCARVGSHTRAGGRVRRRDRTLTPQHLVAMRGLTREEAYVLSSVAVDLKISEVVDTPNWVVSAFLPLAVFGS